MIPTPEIPALKLPRTVRGRQKARRIVAPDTVQPTRIDLIPDVEVSFALASPRGSGKRTNPKAPAVGAPMSIEGIPDVEPKAPRLARNLRGGRVRPARVHAPEIPDLADIPDL